MSDTLDMSISLTNLSNSNIIVGSTANNNFSLGSSSGDSITAGPGDSLFATSLTATSLGGDQLIGGPGVNFVEVGGSKTTIDLTQSSTASGAGSTGIAAVVGRVFRSPAIPTTDVVDVSLSGVATSGIKSAVGTAFVTVLTTNGVTNLTGSNVTYLGEVSSAGAGYDAAGDKLGAAQTSALAADVTSITNLEGTLAQLFFIDLNLNPATQAYIQNHLNAYVFSSGGKDYTIWSDGAVTLNGSAAYYKAAPSTNAVGGVTSAQEVPMFNPAGDAEATLADNTAGGSSLFLGPSTTGPYGAIQLGAGNKGTIVRNNKSAVGGGYFGLAGSLGGNTIVGTPNGTQFDLGAATSLIDTLQGRSGFNVVTAPHATDVNLTGGNPATSAASSNISAVVGAPKHTETVEVDLSTLATTTVAGVGSAEFEAFLGGTANTLTLTGGVSTGWKEVGKMAPGAALLPKAQALVGPTLLNTYWQADGGVTTATSTAKTRLTGYLFEQIGSSGQPVEFVTIWTDATVVNHLVGPTAVSAMAQAMAQIGATSSVGAASTPAASSGASASPLVLAAAHG
ncbi:MAG TPA: hypothetical protein VHY34_05380 [Caulobacteraceae bacterium]|nr:hypothetical protein [Caulobacteraceae bacterium]